MSRKGKGVHFTPEQLEALKAQGTIQGWRFVSEIALVSYQPPAGKPVKAKRAHKYGAEKVVYDGHTFDSRKEYTRYRVLLLLLKAGEIGYLRLQVPYPLLVNGVLVSTYIADFVYIDARTGLEVVEDVKSVATAKLPAYRKNKKLMKAIYGIDIVEV